MWERGLPGGEEGRVSGVNWGDGDVERSEVCKERREERSCLSGREVWCKEGLEGEGWAWTTKDPEITVDSGVGVWYEVGPVGTDSRPESVWGGAKSKRC